MADTSTLLEIVKFTYSLITVGFRNFPTFLPTQNIFWSIWMTEMNITLSLFLSLLLCAFSLCSRCEWDLVCPYAGLAQVSLPLSGVLWALRRYQVLPLWRFWVPSSFPNLTSPFPGVSHVLAAKLLFSWILAPMLQWFYCLSL